ICSRIFKPLPFDMILGTGPEAVLYADITEPSFAQFHKNMAKAARTGKSSYILRHRRNTIAKLDPLPVSGYGVELALKRTDYIVIDDRDASSESGAKVEAAEVVLDGDEEVADLKPLSNSELSALGMKASSFIMQSEGPFETLIKLAQDFPKYSASIASHN